MKTVARVAVSIGFALIVGSALPIRVSAQGPSDNVTVFARDLILRTLQSGNIRSEI